MPQVTCVTVAYNAEKVLDHTVESILSQTYSCFEYFVIDHGSTDKTWNMIQKYAADDPRIIPVHVDKNNGGSGLINNILSVCKKATGKWLITLDADDEYEKNAFQTLIDEATKKNLDMVCCGTNYIDAATGKSLGNRSVQSPILVDTNQSFSQLLPSYHQFMRTWWGKLISMDSINKCDWSWTNKDNVCDTRFAFECLFQSSKTEILPGTLHRYFLTPGSGYYRLNASNEGKIDARLLADDRMDQIVRHFLVEKIGNVSKQNDDFLCAVHMNAMIDLFKIFMGTHLNEQQLIEGLYDLINNQTSHHLISKEDFGLFMGRDVVETRTALLKNLADILFKLYPYDQTDKIIESFASIGQPYWGQFIMMNPDVLNCTRVTPERICELMYHFYPECSQILTVYNLPVFADNIGLVRSLVQENYSLLMESILDLIQQNKYTRYHLEDTLQALTADNILLIQINNAHFIRNYRDIYDLVLKKEYLEALDQMTGMLLENKVKRTKEVFLNLYLNLAASLEQSVAYVFGTIQLAKLFEAQKRWKECGKLVNDLIEMGEDSNIEVLRMIENLKSIGNC